VLNKEIDESVTMLLQELVRFQERVYQKDPTKAKSKRRLVMGLREVTKHMKLSKIKCVIISPNCEKIQAKGECSGRRGAPLCLWEHSLVKTRKTHISFYGQAFSFPLYW
jgi:hypothetical protein